MREEIKERIKQINKQLTYIRKRDKVCCAIGSEIEQYELIEERKILRSKLKSMEKDIHNKNISYMEEKFRKHSMLECIKYEVLQMIKNNFTSLLENDIITEEKLDDISINILSDNEFNDLLDSLIIEELEGYFEEV